MRYDRSSFASACRAAQTLARKDGTTRYVFATAYGFVVALCSPPRTQEYNQYTITTAREYRRVNGIITPRDTVDVG